MRTETSPDDQSPSRELLAGTRHALLRRLAVGQVDGRVPSLVGAVVRAGRPVWTGGRGTVDERCPDDDVQYRIGSITKTFVAVLVMRLRDEGALRLSDPLERHLPGTVAPSVTIRQLLAHTSGLASETPEPWWERTPGTLRPEVADVLGERPEKHPAGTRFHYSNTGYALLGAVVERLRGEAWFTVLRREVLEPLGMTRTTVMPRAPHAEGFAVHPWADVVLPEPLEDTGVMAPAGQLWSTTADLCRWAAFLAAGDDRVLARDSVAEMTRPAVEPDGEPWSSAYGLGIQLRCQNGQSLHGHNGSMPGFLATVWVSGADDLAAVVLANVTSGTSTADIGADLIRIVAEREPRVPDTWRPLAEADPELLALTGPWYWGAAALALRLRADRALELAPLGAWGRGARFRAEADGTWTGLNGYYAGETLRVVRAADGSVSHLDVGSFVLTRGPYDPAAPVPGGVHPDGWRAG